MMHMAGEGREQMPGRVEVSIPFQVEQCPNTKKIHCLPEIFLRNLVLYMVQYTY